MTNMLENASQGKPANLMHHRGFSTFRRGCVASQRVAGPILCDGLRWSAMLLEAQNRRKNGPFHHIV